MSTRTMAFGRLRMWRPLLMLLLYSLRYARSADDVSSLLNVADAVREQSKEDSQLVCVVVRTYHGHGNRGTGSLAKLLESLQRQHHRRWEALLVVMDQQPFTDLREILREFDDSRIWVYADWIGRQYAPKTPEGTWRKFYHNRLYELTDEAIRACPPDTAWVVITNGDNVYHEDAFSYLDTADGDIVAWDMYSRYQRPSGIPCERFQAGPGAAPCKPNRLKWCHTDLGATAYSWPRLLREGRRFGDLDETGVFTGQDGVMAGNVVDAGWRVDHAQGRCLFDQGPSPQMCAFTGGVWDERTAGNNSGFGGSCISHAEAQAALREGGVESLDIELTHDGAFGGLAGGQTANFTIQCLRPAHDYRYMLARAFGPPCAEAQDAYLHEELAAMRN